ncbi:MAG: transporter [Candidatus Sumerlaeaceae bacterium]
MATDRPDFTETAETVPPRRIQVESGMTFSRTKNEKSRSAGELLIRAGLARRLEARIGLPTYTLTQGDGERLSGLEDSSFGVKISLRKGNEEEFDLIDPKTAVILDTDLPTGAHVHREPHLQPGAKLCLEWPLGKRLSLASNLNYRYASDTGQQFHQLSGSASLGYDLTERVGVYAETFAFSREDRDGSLVQYVNTGVTYAVRENHQIDARVGTAVTGEKPNVFFGVGYSFRF